MAQKDTQRNFQDYEIDINLSIRRRTDRYSSDPLAQVEHKEVLTMKEHDLLGVFDALVSEAAHKASKQTGIKRQFEQEMLALEAGSAIDA